MVPNDTECSALLSRLKDGSEEAFKDVFYAFYGLSPKTRCKSKFVEIKSYLCIMKQWQVLKTIFPEVITDNFEFKDYKETETTLDYWLDEREFMSREDYKSGTVHPYGFTDERTIQDFPIRGRRVLLHIRRRKWIDRSTGEIFSYSYDDLTEEGTRLSPEFVAFLKDAD